VKTQKKEMAMMCKKVLFVMLFIFPLFLSQAEARPKNAAYFVYGNSQTILTEPVTPEGKAYVLQVKGSWLDGALLKIPAGALQKEATLKVSYNDGFFENVSSGNPLDGAVIIEIQGVSKLDNFISLKFPETSAEQKNGCMGYLPDEEGSLSAMTSISKNEIISFRLKTTIALICP